jgi:hypothetical protein
MASEDLLPVDDEDLEKVAEELAGQQPPRNEGPKMGSLANWIVLPGKGYQELQSYPDLLVCLFPSYPDRKERSWPDSHKYLRSQGRRMLTIRQFFDFWNLLKDGAENGASVYNAEGNRALPGKLREGLKVITEGYLRDTYSEWLDARFTPSGSSIGMFHSHSGGDGRGLYEAVNIEVIKEMCIADISSLNHQGLPVRPAQQLSRSPENFGYYPPTGNQEECAYFGQDAGSIGRVLVCYENPRVKKAVRHAIAKPADLIIPR